MKDWILITATLLAVLFAMALAIFACTYMIFWVIEVAVGIAMAVI